MNAVTEVSRGLDDCSHKSEMNDEEDLSAPQSDGNMLCNAVIYCLTSCSRCEHFAHLTIVVGSYALGVFSCGFLARFDMAQRGTVSTLFHKWAKTACCKVIMNTKKMLVDVGILSLIKSCRLAVCLCVGTLQACVEGKGCHS